MATKVEIKKFLKFLEVNKIKKAYYTNFRPLRILKDVNEFLESVDTGSFINEAFIWDNTPEKFDFWDSFDSNWTKLY